MREHLAGLRLLFGTAVKEAPGRLALALLQTLGSSLAALNPLWAGLLVGAAITADARSAGIAVAGLIVTTAIGWILGLVGAEARVTLAERVSFAMDRRIAVLTATIPTLTHHERPDFVDQVQVLRRNRGILGGGLSSILHGVDHVVSAAIILILAATVDPRLLLVALTAVPPLLAGRLRHRWTETAENASAPYGRLAEHYRTVATNPATGMEIRVFGLQHEILDRLRDAGARREAPLIRAVTKTARLRLVEDLVFAIVLTGVLGWLVATADGPGAAASIAVAVVAARQIQTVVVQAVHGFSGEGGLVDTLRTLGRLRWLQTYADSQISPDATLPAPDQLAAGITLTDATFTYYGANRPSIQNLTATLPAGQVVAVVGENGAGKTTLAKLLTGMHHLDSGTISIDQTPLDRLDIDAWRRQTSAAFQDHTRLELTAQHTIGLGQPADADDQAAAEAAALRGGAQQLIDALPGGLDTQLGSQWPHGRDLSGGQWQTLALARSQMRPQPLLLILDEPTAALDAHAEHTLFQRFTAASEAARLRGGITLLVTHRFTTIQDADLILVLDQGRLIESGTHSQLMSQHGHYAELYALQASGYR